MDKAVWEGIGAEINAALRGEATLSRLQMGELELLGPEAIPLLILQHSFGASPLFDNALIRRLNNIQRDREGEEIAQAAARGESIQIRPPSRGLEDLTQKQRDALKNIEDSIRRQRGKEGGIPPEERKFRADDPIGMRLRRPRQTEEKAPPLDIDQDDDTPVSTNVRVTPGQVIAGIVLVGSIVDVINNLINTGTTIGALKDTLEIPRQAKTIKKKPPIKLLPPPRIPPPTIPPQTQPPPDPEEEIPIRPPRGMKDAPEGDVEEEVQLEDDPPLPEGDPPEDEPPLPEDEPPPPPPPEDEPPPPPPEDEPPVEEVKEPKPTPQEDPIPPIPIQDPVVREPITANIQQGNDIVVSTHEDASQDRTPMLRAELVIGGEDAVQETPEQIKLDTINWIVFDKANFKNPNKNSELWKSYEREQKQRFSGELFYPTGKIRDIIPVSEKELKAREAPFYFYNTRGVNLRPPAFKSIYFDESPFQRNNPETLFTTLVSDANTDKLKWKQEKYINDNF